MFPKLNQSCGSRESGKRGDEYRVLEDGKRERVRKEEQTEAGRSGYSEIGSKRQTNQ
jgi:hypothetical protein